MASSLSSLVRIQLVLLTLCVCNLTFGLKYDALDPPSVSRTRVSIVPRKQDQYTRTEEVKEKCPLLTPRELQPDDQAHYRMGGDVRLHRKLSFEYGYWEEEEPGSTSILPFLQLNDTKFPTKMKLASFSVTDIANNLMLKGILRLIITDGESLFSLRRYREASFTSDPGLSVLTIEVEGIYQPTENEDVVCMLGCALLPSPDGPYINNSSSTKDLEKNCNIQVQLNYPLIFNLTSQIVRGTVHSLVPLGQGHYFSPITFSSQARGRPYQGARAEFVNKACPADSSSELDSTDSAYNGPIDEFCAITSGYFLHSLLDIEPNWMCNGTTQNCRTIGPFSSYAESTAFLADYNTSRARILVQPVMSNPCHFLNAAPEEIPLSLVLRLVPAVEPEIIARQSFGLDGRTLVAEGYLTNRSSTICMIACKVDDASGQTDNCNFKVTLQIPLILTITQRNIYKGSISSLLAPNHSESFFPLAFYAKIDLNNRNLPYTYSSTLRYNYSRLEFAGAILNKYEPESRSRLKTPWSKYPTLIGEEDGHYQSLADDLNFQSDLKSSKGQWNFLSFDLVAMDKYLPFAYTKVLGVNDTIVTKTEPRLDRRQEARKYLNCSGTLDFVGQIVDGVASRLTIFTEGFYNPVDGKIYMVGCRTIKDSWEQIVQSSADLIEGMDCEIEVVLQYPTTLSAWLLNPGVKVKVHSNRPVTNEFHFADISTETYPIFYKGQRKEVISLKSFEAALSVLALSLTLVCIICQLLYIGNHAESTPYISLSMLGAQAMGYAIPLVTGAESLLTRKFDYRQDHSFWESGSVQMGIYVDKVMTLVALLLFLRIFEKVWRERESLSDRGHAGNVPRERNVVVICFIIHAVGFISIVGLHSQHSRASGEIAPDVDIINVPRDFERGNDMENSNVFRHVERGFDVIRRGRMWHVSQEYAGLIEDLFLLPQVVGLGLWDDTGKPLRKSYFLGLTLLQIVPHIYDYLRPTQFGSPIYANPDFDFYTHVGNTLIPALALILALLVYCQQRWKGFLRLPRKFRYQHLGTKSSETELVSNNGRYNLPPIPEDEE